MTEIDALMRREYLLIQLCSEAVEVAHRVTKAQHFGLAQVQDGQPLSNAERIADELKDLIAVMRMCIAEGYIPKPDLGSGAILRKQNRVERFMAYAMGGDRPSDDATKS